MTQQRTTIIDGNALEYADDTYIKDPGSEQEWLSGKKAQIRQHDYTLWS